MHQVFATNLWASILNQPAQIGYASKRTEADYGSVHEQKEILSQKTKERFMLSHHLALLSSYIETKTTKSRTDLYIIYLLLHFLIALYMT